jgi:quercetin dioxygenase-like cupin family protein
MDMASLETKSFDSPDETRTPDKTTVEVVKLKGTTVGRYTFEPGWRWSETVKLVAKTDSCEVDHVGYVLQGRLHVRHDDGSEAEVGPGDVYHINPKHDAWVVGQEKFLAVEFQGAADYAK